ncbi:putative membrane protein [Nostocoides japonicum T1-X7]|uniref:Putative membrane protein n=1 Tax=Nostocoides japonicum T1-X7 TaxID=1194083 RepID=A0A077M1L7_9MICO|nr:TlyA family RNA methyltransferase [Tetrasphaera japonica]CCH78115.1 putative membrane protein [Tetrasphaera japonica T1-X7]
MSGRLDTELVARGLARSRGHAQELIDAGRVMVAGRPAVKAATAVPDEVSIEVSMAGPVWVSRGAEKLCAAFAAWGPQGLTAHGKRCIDVGASTGGFTQVLLHEGAASVVALDVGHGQLAAVVADDPRVEERSGRTVRGLDPKDVRGPFALLVADLSFISLTLVLPTLATLVEEDGDAVLLVKPQFEVGRERLGKNGVVRSAGDRALAVAAVARAARSTGLTVLGLTRSPLRGGAGNVEYLLWLTRREVPGLGWEAVMAAADRIS